MKRAITIAHESCSKNICQKHALKKNAVETNENLSNYLRDRQHCTIQRKANKTNKQQGKHLKEQRHRNTRCLMDKTECEYRSVKRTVTQHAKT